MFDFSFYLLFSQFVCCSVCHEITCLSSGSVWRMLELVFYVGCFISFCCLRSRSGCLGQAVLVHIVANVRSFMLIRSGESKV
jgi:hypothetical protein